MSSGRTGSSSCPCWLWSSGVFWGSSWERAVSQSRSVYLLPLTLCDVRQIQPVVRPLTRTKHSIIVLTYVYMCTPVLPLVWLFRLSFLISYSLTLCCPLIEAALWWKQGVKGQLNPKFNQEVCFLYCVSDKTKNNVEETSVYMYLYWHQSTSLLDLQLFQGWKAS